MAPDAVVADMDQQRQIVERLGDAVRELIESTCGVEAPPGELERAIADVRQVTECLRSFGRPLGVAPSLDDPALLRLYTAGHGVGNPVAPPVRFEVTADGVRSRLTLARQYEGPLGRAHGGVSSLLLDEVLGHASTSAGRGGFTAYLNVVYHRPVPILVPLEIRAHIEVEDGRKTIVNGFIALESEPDVALVSATALFVIPRNSHKGVALV